jgi:hypothetical protein
MSATATQGPVSQIHPKTHFVALCGVISLSASPKKDGWFFSDFYLFNHMFAGLGASRAWITCVNPQDLIRDHREYVHGNPYQARRIVLDKDTPPHDILVQPETKLLENFLEIFEKECQNASQAKEPVLLMLFGHGDYDTHGVAIGRFPGEASDEQTPLLGISHINSIVERFPGLQLGILITSCFSGTWAIKTRSTTMTAAGESRPSEAWPDSESLGRACGSIFTSAIVRLLVEEDEQAGHSQGPFPSKDYQTFTNDIRTKILRLDRFGNQHEEMFSAQDDKWTDEYHQRTGIPTSQYIARLEKLKTVKSTDKTKHPYGDRTSDEQLIEWGQSTGDDTVPMDRNWFNSMTGRTGGSRPALERAVLVKARQYQASFPGRPSLGPNIVLNSLIRTCRESKATDLDLQELSSTLLYRENTGLLAEKIRDIMGLGPFPRFQFWDFEKDFFVKYGHKCRQIEAEYLTAISEGKLIPKPLSGEGREWIKPQQYLAAACYEEGLGVDEVKKRVEAAKQVLLKTERLLKDELAEEFGGRKTGTWYQTVHESVRRVLRSRSRSPKKPGKRSSIGDAFSGLSLGSPGRK